MALAAVVPYLPYLTIPFISDDYVQVYLARQYGGVDGWPALAQDALYRCRATSLLLTHWIDDVFGLVPAAHNTAGILIHLLNTILVFLLGSWARIGWKASFAAAIFFGLYEGHQEAVIWNAALPELLVFTFSLLCLLAWLAWLRRGGWAWGAATLVSFALALLSKESAVALLPVLAAVLWIEARRDRMAWGTLAALTALSAGYAWAIFQTPTHLHLNDGTFSLRAPFWITLPHSILRMLWIWGAAALAALGVLRAARYRWLVAAGFFGMVAGLLPYSFLTYMNRVPSRHTYFASAGLALIAAAGWLAFRERVAAMPRAVPAAALALVALHNCGYLWIKKMPQYERRAEVTERFLEFAAQKTGPIAIRCSPYGSQVMQYAAALVLNRDPETVIDARHEPPDEPDAIHYCDASTP